MTHTTSYERVFVMMVEGASRRIDNACEITRTDRGQFLRDAINVALDRAYKSQFEQKES